MFEEELPVEKIDSLYELDQMLKNNDFDYIDEDEPEMIYRHPSNKGTIIIDDNNVKMFVPDARFRKKRLRINNEYSYNKYRISDNQNVSQLYNYLHNNFVNNSNYSSTKINNKILEYNRLNFDYSIFCFDYCNNIRIPKVGNCIIPSLKQMETIIEYRKPLDEFDISPVSHQNKLLKNWFDNLWSTEFMTCDLILDYGKLAMNTLYVNHSFKDIEPYSVYLDERYLALIPIIEL